jgi:hypothetical protein
MLNGEFPESIDCRGSGTTLAAPASNRKNKTMMVLL